MKNSEQKSCDYDKIIIIENFKEIKIIILMHYVPVRNVYSFPHLMMN